ncbi:MAG TPA: TolC family protein [Candidatus Aminicenantes bacterium]|nr:TolC family protein [Candidatus Aminicenantes bacterium]
MRPVAAAAAAVLVVGLSGFGADETPAALTLDQCIAMSLAENPLWLSAEEDYQASLARVREAKSFPQPALEYDSDLQPSFLDFRGSGESYFGISQTLEFPGRRSLRGKIAALESREYLADKSLLRLDLVFQVKEVFFSVLLADEKRKYAAQDLELARDFKDKAEAKYEAGDVARVEVVRATVEASKAETAVMLAENEVRLAKARLNYLLGRPKLEPLEIRGELTTAPVAFDRDALVERAIRARPEAEKARAALAKEERRKTEAVMSYLPDFDLGFARHRIAGEVTTWDFTLSVPIPLFFWQPARGRIAEAQAQIRSSERQAEDLANRIGLEVGEAWLSAQAAEAQIALFEKDILTQAEESFDLIRFSFQEGEVGGIELIDARRTLLEVRKSYADALYNYRITLAALERSVGEPLEGDDDDQ